MFSALGVKESTGRSVEMAGLDVEPVVHHQLRVGETGANSPLPTRSVRVASMYSNDSG
ncbi:hypothetical protein [Chlorobaculum sp. 24CR]|uniref:hypothetical protein n=1 Tax=Chlorobaculum sp. 24CR TaxID=2508878 RepID=UPI00142F3F04|nr:hypothetical protein [Chlorobaculum sp. 24CR]